MSLYILVSEVNDYNQYGQYFKYAWNHKPSKEELHTTLIEKCGEIELPIEEVIINLLNNGGGRIGIEFEWYHLLEIKT